MAKRVPKIVPTRQSFVPSGSGSNSSNNSSSPQRQSAHSFSPKVQSPKGATTMVSNHNNYLEQLAEDEDTTPRRSFYFSSTNTNKNPQLHRIFDEIDNVERLIALTLQSIDSDLSASNKIITNKLLPTLNLYNENSAKIFGNVAFIKEFFENAANVTILTQSDLKQGSAIVQGIPNGAGVNKGNTTINNTTSHFDLGNLEEDEDSNLTTDEITTITTNIMQRYKANFSSRSPTRDPSRTVTLTKTGNILLNPRKAILQKEQGEDTASFSEPPSSLQHLMKSPSSTRQKLLGQEAGNEQYNSNGILMGPSHQQNNYISNFPAQGDTPPQQSDFQEESTHTQRVGQMFPRLAPPTSSPPPNDPPPETNNNSQEKEVDNSKRQRERSLSPNSKRKKIVSAKISQYDSPPWEEPPELQSAIVMSPIKLDDVQHLPGTGNTDLNDSSDEEMMTAFSALSGRTVGLLGNNSKFGKGRSQAVEHSSISSTLDEPPQLISDFIPTLIDKKKNNKIKHLNNEYHTDNITSSISTTTQQIGPLLERAKSNLKTIGIDPIMAATRVRFQKSYSEKEGISNIEEHGVDSTDSNNLDEPPILQSELLRQQRENQTNYQSGTSILRQESDTTATINEQREVNYRDRVSSNQDEDNPFVE